MKEKSDAHPYTSHFIPSKDAVEQVSKYIEDIITNRQSGESWWMDERGTIHTTDVGYGIELMECILDELRRVAY